MQLLIHMYLESDAVFGNGMSMPGGEDICIQTDLEGFPYLKGSTLKGIFREELINYLAWEKKTDMEALKMINELLGESGSNDLQCSRRLIFSDLSLHPDLIGRIREEKINKQEILAMFSYLRVFTGLEEGIVKKESLRTARCIKKGLNFYGICTCWEQDVELVQEILKLIKWVGSMRSRGFGEVRIRGEEMEA